MFKLYVVGKEKDTTISFDSLGEVKAFLLNVYDSVTCGAYIEGLKFACITTAMSQWKRTDWFLYQVDEDGSLISYKDWEK
ncbi:MAG: hypothetical protein RR744_09280 [Cellulosilyticaceae bacterium]